MKILLINPSFGSRPEQHAWASLAEGVRQGRATVHVWAARPVATPDEFEPTIRPAKLVDHADELLGSLGPLERTMIPPRPAWISGEDVARHADWEQRRHVHPFDPLSLVRGIHLLAAEVDEVLDGVDPDVVVTTNKIDHPCALFRAGAIARGTPSIVVERSPVAGLWFEHAGIFAESRIGNAWSDHDSTSEDRHAGDRARRHLIDDPATFRAREDYRGEPAGTAPHVLLPMDNAAWTGWAQPDHPQGDVDYPWLRSPQQAIDAVASAAAAAGLDVHLRPHPSCREVDRWVLPPNVAIDRSPLSDALRSAVGCVAFNTKVVFPAVAAGLPTVTCSPNPIEPGELTTSVRDEQALRAIVQRMADGSAARPTDERIEQYFGFLVRSVMVGEPMGPELTPDTIPDLIERLVGSVDRTASSSPRRGVETPDGASTTGPRLILDVSRLQEGGSRRFSGIAEYERQLLGALVTARTRGLHGLIRSVGGSATDLELATVSDLANALDGRLIALAPGLIDSPNSPLATLGEDDCLHSLHLALPPRPATGRARRILTVHDVIHEFRPELDNRPTSEISEILDASLADADHLICVSSQTRRDLHQSRPLGDIPTSVIMHGTIGPRPDEDLRPRWWETGGPSVVLPVQESRRKNVINGVRALNAVAAQPTLDAVRFVLAGSANAVDGADRHLSPGARRRTDRLVAPEVDELRAAYRGAAVVLFPSAFEGFGMIPLDAMAQGAVVVTPWNSSLAEVCGDGVEYALGTDARTLGRALLRVLTNESLRADLVDRATVRAAMMTWDRTASAHRRIYDQVVARGDHVA